MPGDARFVGLPGRNGGLDVDSQFAQRQQATFKDPKDLELKLEPFDFDDEDEYLNLYQQFDKLDENTTNFNVVELLHKWLDKFENDLRNILAGRSIIIQNTTDIVSIDVKDINHIAYIYVKTKIRPGRQRWAIAYFKHDNPNDIYIANHPVTILGLLLSYNAAEGAVDLGRVFKVSIEKFKVAMNISSNLLEFNKICEQLSKPSSLDEQRDQYFGEDEYFDINDQEDERFIPDKEFYDDFMQRTANDQTDYQVAVRSNKAGVGDGQGSQSARQRFSNNTTNNNYPGGPGWKMTQKDLRRLIRNEAINLLENWEQRRADAMASDPKLADEPVHYDDEDEQDEASVVGGISGYSLPVGMSNWAGGSGGGWYDPERPKPSQYKRTKRKKSKK